MNEKYKEKMLIGGAFALGITTAMTIFLYKELKDEKEINECQEEIILKLENTLNKVEGGY